MTASKPRPKPEEMGRVLPFPPRGKARDKAQDKAHLRVLHDAPPGDGPVEDVGKYTHGSEPDDYRQRMINNALALAFCVVLVAIGVWIAASIAEMRRNQDCVLSGRRNCANVVAPVSAVKPD